MSYVYSYARTMAGARAIVVDEGLTIAPPAKSKRERIIEMSRRWNEAHRPAEVEKPCRRQRKKPDVDMTEETKQAISMLKRHGMPEYAQEIVLRVAEEHGVSPLALAAENRSQRIVPIRYEVFYRLKTTPSPTIGVLPSYPQIGRWFGREHTGVLWGATKHAAENDLPKPSNLNLEHSAKSKRARALARVHAIRDAK
ncbi:hypothetical protein [Mesorhizobium amorphae]|uniref:hypothetical protein n=1 Tax=Mesorhizobium amorphae TaxID=71433 RepID=UPI001184D640|nr:hypothetical protein [Mesorhizobium amorphae]